MASKWEKKNNWDGTNSYVLNDLKGLPENVEGVAVFPVVPPDITRAMISKIKYSFSVTIGGKGHFPVVDGASGLEDWDFVSTAKKQALIYAKRWGRIKLGQEENDEQDA